MGAFLHTKKEAALRLRGQLVSCIIAMSFIFNSHYSRALGAGRPITIKDIIGIRKLGAISISPDGQAAAYLVIHAIVAKDAYSVTLVVTSTQDTSEHKEIVTREVPAVRTEVGDVLEDIGSNVTAGIVFTWTRGGRELVYGVPEGTNTSLFSYIPGTGQLKPLRTILGKVTTLEAFGQSKYAYCIVRRPLSMPANGSLVDPAYRYDQATFHFWDKHPWQDGRAYNDRSRPWTSPAAPVDCFEREEGREPQTPIDKSRLEKADWRKPLQGAALSQVGDRAYQGNPAVGAWVSPDRKYILFIADVRQTENAGWERKTVAWVERKTPGGKQVELFQGEGEREGGIQIVFWSPDSKFVVGIRKSLDHTQVVRFDINTGQESSLLKTAWGFYEPRLSPSGRFLYGIREKPDTPEQLARLDLLTGKMLLIDNFNRQLEGVLVPPYKIVRQFNQYGDELTGYMFYPPGFHGEERLPFVAIRGQDWDAFCDGGTGVEFPGMVMALKGFITLFYEPSSKHFPPSSDGNAAFSSLRFKSPIENLRLLIADLDQKGWVDPQKTGIAGLSAGADIVNYAAGFSNVFSVGSPTTGEAYSPTNYFIFDSEQVEGLFTKRYALPYPDKRGMPAWQKVSASLNASQSDMPLLFQPGDAEAWITVPQHIAWKHAGLPVATYVYPDEGHIKVHPLNRYFVMTRNLQWFDFWLRNIIDTRPEFADQFKRWETMRDGFCNKDSKDRANVCKTSMRTGARALDPK